MSIKKTLPLPSLTKNSASYSICKQASRCVAKR